MTTQPSKPTVVEATDPREAIARMLVPYWYGGLERQERNADGHWEYPPGTPNARAYEIADRALAIGAGTSVTPHEGGVWLPPAESLRVELRQAMTDAWNTICADTDCHPLDIKHQGRKLYFEPAHWADLVAATLFDRLSHSLSWSSGRPQTTQPTDRELLEAAVERMGWPEINAYRAELARGQSIDEDAGGYFIRALRRLFGLPASKSPDGVVTYQEAARAMVEASPRSQEEGAGK